MAEDISAVSKGFLTHIGNLSVGQSLVHPRTTLAAILIHQWRDAGYDVELLRRVAQLSGWQEVDDGDDGAAVHGPTQFSFQCIPPMQQSQQHGTSRNASVVAGLLNQGGNAAVNCTMVAGGIAMEPSMFRLGVG